jgi:hypothetical protein
MKRLVLTCLVLAMFATAASAHRLDEYLQATRIDVEVDRIDLDIDLTPGAAVARGIVETIDLDADGTLSKKETTEYAAKVIRSLYLTMDGRSLNVALLDVSFPAIDEMWRGEGVIRLRARAAEPVVNEGRHRVDFRNDHRADIGVYLVNALLPGDERIHITGQSRDMLQRQVSVDYQVTTRDSTTRFASALPLVLGLAIAGVLLTILRAA